MNSSSTLSPLLSLTGFAAGMTVLGCSPAHTPLSGGENSPGYKTILVNEAPVCGGFPSPGLMIVKKIQPMIRRDEALGSVCDLSIQTKFCVPPQWSMNAPSYVVHLTLTTPNSLREPMGSSIEVNQNCSNLTKEFVSTGGPIPAMEVPLPGDCWMTVEDPECQFQDVFHLSIETYLDLRAPSGSPEKVPLKTDRWYLPDRDSL